MSSHQLDLCRLNDAKAPRNDGAFSSVWLRRSGDAPRSASHDRASVTCANSKATATLMFSNSKDAGAMLAEQYFELGKSWGYNMPRIAPYHSGPFRFALILQDPGSSHLSGAGSQTTGEIGVYNPDPTACFVRETITAAGFDIAEMLPLNALPGYDLRATVAELRKGAAFNAHFLRLARIPIIVLGGRIAQRIPPVGPWRIVTAPHPSRRNRSIHKSAGPEFEAAIRGLLP